MIQRASAIIVKDGRLALIHRDKQGREYWVLPGGKVEEGETVEEALKREIEEELSLYVYTYKKVFSVTDEFGKEFVCFVVYSEKDRLELNGDSEERRNSSPENVYEPRWVEIGSLEKLNIKPDGVRAELLKLLIPKSHQG